MTYAVKETFLTLQGEGVQSGSRAVFLRFAGCNLWSGREEDRASAQCNFCDTDFVGTDGSGGGKFATAEALAEYHHKKMREELGISGDDSTHIRDLFHQKYRGSRYSFGYPACPNLEDQTKLFALLKPEENVGVRLTSGFLLEPEQSTSAIVVHHPQAKYFVV